MIQWITNHLEEFLIAGAKSLGLAIFHFSDIAILVAVVLCIFGIMGSKRAWKWTYWTAAFYLVIKVIGSYV